MAKCIYCGRPAGIYNDQHPDCATAAKDRVAAAEPVPGIISQLDGAAARSRSRDSSLDSEEFARQLKPLIYGAGWRAGVAAALTLAAVALVLGLLKGLFSAVFF